MQLAVVGVGAGLPVTFHMTSPGKEAELCNSQIASIARLSLGNLNLNSKVTRSTKAQLLIYL